MINESYLINIAGLNIKFIGKENKVLRKILGDFNYNKIESSNEYDISLEINARKYQTHNASGGFSNGL